MSPDEIKDYRRRKGLTQTELGKICGVGKSSVSQWESGATEPSGSSLVILNDLVSGERMLIPLTPLEERLLNELQERRGFENREDLLKALVLEEIEQSASPKKKGR